jgi:Ca2+-binding RTX toxin-like protein
VGLLQNPFGLGCQQNSFSPGTPTADILNGGNGDDRLTGHSGGDTLNGGLNVDTVSYADKQSAVTAAINGLANSGQEDTDTGTPGNQPENDRIATDNENLIGGGGNDTLSGSTAPNAISGGFGTDVLNGGGNNDVLDPGTGSGDRVIGGTGFDLGTYTGSPGNGGVNISLDGVANDSSSFGNENDDFETDVEGALGGAGSDTLSGPTAAIANTLVGFGGPDSLNGRAGNDSLTGGSGFDTLLGEDGNDLLSMADGEPDHPNSDCGGGTGDRVMFDSGLDSFVNCEITQPVAPSLAGPAAADPKSAEFRRMVRTIRGL